MKPLLLLCLLAALACLTTFQTNRSIYVRSLGLFLILGVTLVSELQTPGPMDLILVIAMSTVVVLGFASDYYAASLRTWYFRASDQAAWGLVIGSFIGLLMNRLFPSLLLFLLGSLIGAMIGEIRARGMRSATQLGKAVLGTFAGVYGMSLKLLLGMEMTYWYLFFG